MADSSVNYERLVDDSSPAPSTESSLSVLPAERPHDHRNLLWLAFLMLGCGVLLPWNMIIGVPDFWDDQFGKEKQAMDTFTVAYQSSMLCGLLLFTLFGVRFSFRVRILPPLCMYLVLLGVLPYISSFDVTVALIAMLGFVNAFVQGTAFALAGMYEQTFLGSFMTGQALAGLGTSLLKVFAKGVMSKDCSYQNGDTGCDVFSTRVFFGICCLVVLCVILLYWRVVEASPITVYFTAYSSPAISSEFTQHYMNRTDEADELHRVLKSQEFRDSVNQSFSTSVQDVEQAAGFTEDKAEETQQHSVQAMVAQYREVLPLMWPHMLSVFYCFFVTLSLFPVITFMFPSTIPGFVESGWYAVLLLVGFNAGDVLGRYLPGYILCRDKMTHVLAFLRTLLFVLFLMIVNESVFVGDWWGYLAILLLGASNGYVGTVTMIYGTDDRVPVTLKNAAGSLLVVSLSLGLTAGSYFMNVVVAFNNDVLN